MKEKDVYILGIESSCDETSCSIVKNGKEEIATIILSQIDIHCLYGGVVPEIASRNHVKDITVVIEKCLEKANMTMDMITAIAVTYGPGLIGSLLVGLEAAKTLSYIFDKPLIKVHHIAGHIYANNIEKEAIRAPFISIEDFQTRCKVSQTLIDKMRTMGIFEGMPETSQLSLF